MGGASCRRVTVIVCLAASMSAVYLGAVPDAAPAAPHECVIPEILMRRAGVVGQPFHLWREVLCLPSGDTFSAPEIDWGDGTTSAGTMTVLEGSLKGRVAVSGEHVYDSPGGYWLGGLAKEGAKCVC